MEVREISALAARVERMYMAVVAVVVMGVVYSALCVAEGVGDLIYWWGQCGVGVVLCVQGARVWWANVAYPWWVKRQGLVAKPVLDLQRPTPPQPAEPSLPEEDHIQKVSTLRATEQYAEARAAAQAGLTDYPTSLPLLTLLCKAANDEASANHKGAVQENALRAGCKAASLLIKHHPGEAVGYRWRAVLEGRLSSYKPTKEKIAGAMGIRDDALKAIELDPTDPISLHVMGAWCHGVAKISWIERKAAAALFGTPPTSTLEEALEYLKRADAIEAFTENSMLIGDCLKELKKLDEADSFYEAAIRQIQGPKDPVALKAKIVKKMTKKKGK
eukprot:TRINITY_DN850_c0_g1_i11.p1 TRINITY_DN850_c0_g1~~TRINITY_DN850_c0_g1_i11.p1  ORF type:complete len:353 (+),score=76.98 TRINITY_DN850_c0_g1_i11:69-1061(+)